MASAAQIEAFAWWLGQSPSDRTAAKIAERFSVPDDTAEKWRTAFGRQLAKVASESVETHLKAYRAEYEVIQSRTLTVLPGLIDGIEANARAIRQSAENGGLADADLIGKTVAALKSVYSLAESASGADIAKRRASQKPSDGGGSAVGLPDFSALFALGGSAASNSEAVAIDAQAVAIPEKGNEKPGGSAASVKG
jgi:hypothetical protein